MENIIGASIILRYKEFFVFELQKKHKWVLNDSGRYSIGVGCIGGGIEQGESPIEALHRECDEEVMSKILIYPVNQTLMINQDYKISSLEEITESQNVLFYWHGYNNAKICTFYGEVLGNPKPNDLAGLLFTNFDMLFDAFKKGRSLGEIVKEGAVLIKKHSIPMDSVIRPVGTVNVLNEINKQGKIEVLNL